MSRRDEAELIGKTVGGKYKIDRLLGAGGMGTVFAATVTSQVAGANGEDLPKTVAIKVLSVADPSSRDRIAARFAREARAATALKCPYIVTVLDAGSEDTRPYLVMELLEGEDLGQRLRRDSRVPLDQALHITAQVLVALGSAHEAGIVHRDLKPDNVFLVKREADVAFCKLLDFGMSKFLPHREGQTLALALTKKGMAVGTPFYMAPEQARALEDVDGRADLWALGAILFECLAGRPPFIAKTQEQILIAVCTTDAPDIRALRPEVPSKVSKLIKRALTREREKRFSNAWEMLTALIDAAPAEAALMPASITTTQDIPPLSPDATGPTAFSQPISNPTPSLNPSRSPSPIPSPSRSPSPTPSSMRRLLPIFVAVIALALGVSVTLYVLSHAR